MSTDAPSANPKVAYFCMEYGLHHKLPIYSGGLGVLAGDHMKSVGDLNIPLVGIGLLWNEGYVTQLIDAEGKPDDHYPTTPRNAVSEVAGLEVSVEVSGRDVPCRVFKVDRYLSSTLYLLEPSQESDRWITRRLYGGGEEDRLAQEIVLGVGGVRLLRALGHEVEVYHFNEGHAVFAGLELIREQVAKGKSFTAARKELRSKIVFTTHTPVPAGNEVHPLALLRRMGADCGFADEQLEELGGSPFSMTVAGLRLARDANGVAELHSETARQMWSAVQEGAPIHAITNGVHVPTWQDARVRAAVVPDKSPKEQSRELWEAHQQMKAELIAEISERNGVELKLDQLLIGFARRAASYKRADLIFGDSKRLERLFDAGLQLVFSGKAHPRDELGKALVCRLVEASKRYPKRVVFLENYAMDLGALLTRGCDVWLNNPRRPQEASGTSGMKAAMNGVPNLSILDGWWPEGCRHGETGWRIGEGKNTELVESGTKAAEALDARDLEALYQVLEKEVLPTYAKPESWRQIMAASVAMSSWKFSSDRMVQDYVRIMYRRPRS